MLKNKLDQLIVNAGYGWLASKMQPFQHNKYHDFVLWSGAGTLWFIAENPFDVKVYLNAMLEIRRRLGDPDFPVKRASPQEWFVGLLTGFDSTNADFLDTHNLACGWVKRKWLLFDGGPHYAKINRTLVESGFEPLNTGN